MTKSAIPSTVLVTGAEGALGQVVAARFVKSGAKVLGTHHPSRAGSLPNEPGVTWVSLDLTDPKAVREGVAKLGDVDALVHCAGGFRWKQLETTTDEDLDFLFNVNLRSAFHLLRELLPGMKKRNFGRVVLVSARSTFAPNAGVSAYTASKAGINALVASLADETRDFDINVNAVMPTMIDTEANRRDMPKSDFSKWVPREELAEIMFSLTQPWGRSIHGALIPVAGRL